MFPFVLLLRHVFFFMYPTIYDSLGTLRQECRADKPGYELRVYVQEIIVRVPAVTTAMRCGVGDL